eukprot:312036-Chlamydomonas_euryale.AAC.1
MVPQSARSGWGLCTPATPPPCGVAEAEGAVNTSSRRNVNDCLQRWTTQTAACPQQSAVNRVALAFESALQDTVRRAGVDVHVQPTLMAPVAGGHISGINSRAEVWTLAERASSRPRRQHTIFLEPCIHASLLDTLWVQTSATASSTASCAVDKNPLLC